MFGNGKKSKASKNSQAETPVDPVPQSGGGPGEEQPGGVSEVPGGEKTLPVEQLQPRFTRDGVCLSRVDRNAEGVITKVYD